MPSKALDLKELKELAEKNDIEVPKGAKKAAVVKLLGDAGVDITGPEEASASDESNASDDTNTLESPEESEAGHKAGVKNVKAEEVKGSKTKPAARGHFYVLNFGDGTGRGVSPEGNFITPAAELAKTRIEVSRHEAIRRSRLDVGAKNAAATLPK